jgi:hypothetical protein
MLVNSEDLHISAAPTGFLRDLASAIDGTASP